jgi:hypothetical protein
MKILAASDMVKLLIPRMIKITGVKNEWQLNQ